MGRHWHDWIPPKPDVYYEVAQDIRRREAGIPLLYNEAEQVQYCGRRRHQVFGTQLTYHGSRKCHYCNHLIADTALSLREGPIRGPRVRSFRSISEEPLFHRSPKKPKTSTRIANSDSLSLNMTAPMPRHLIPFTPYIEKGTWEPKTLVDPRSLFSHHVQLNTLKNWLTICERRHGLDCQHQQAGADRAALWLIDVDRMCLTSATQNSRYVALSYVWGNSESSFTSTANRSSLCLEQSLSHGSYMVPQVVTDAMQLVKELGERYLWVDRFCIIQDGADKQNQLDAMGRIYGSAQFTIVAAQNVDANAGLYGTRKVCVAVEQPDTAHANDGYRDKIFLKDCLMNEEVLLHYGRSLMRTKWYSRGWTFQEHLFSRRKIIFHDNTVNWECQHSSWHETQDLSKLLDSNHSYPPNQIEGLVLADQAPNPFLSTWPDLFRYSRLVSLYNRRALTYPEDVLDAFRGALSQLSCVYPGGFISGLPHMFFNSSLLWQPWNPITRRRSSRRGGAATILPS